MSCQGNGRLASMNGIGSGARTRSSRGDRHGAETDGRRTQDGAARGTATRGTVARGGRGDAARRARIGRLVELARIYLGWTPGELAAALGREPTRVAPETGNPKLDLVQRLADALDWEPGDLVACLGGDGIGCGAGDASRQARDPARAARAARLDAQGFAALDLLAQRQHRSARFSEMEETARAMWRTAIDGRGRAIALNRLAGAQEGRGHYGRVVETVRRGLAERAIGDDVRLMLLVNLAGASYALWNLHESRSIAEGLLERFLDRAPRGRLESVGEAFCHAIRGHSLRRLVAEAECDDERIACARRAARALGHAAELYDGLHDRYGDAQYAMLARIARGGLLEARVVAGEIDGGDAIALVLEAIDEAESPRLARGGGVGGVGGCDARDAEEARGAALGPRLPLGREPSLVRSREPEGESNIEPSIEPPLESTGWWSVFGANIALRRAGEGLAGARERDDDERAIAICTNKATEIGDALDLWTLRERAFTLGWFRRTVVASPRAGEFDAWLLDDEDLRTLVGTMGRFPAFRATGWRILEHATHVGAGN
ncbi:MAG: hypothetical protein RI967_1956 [Planctomycetota bacterium]